MTATVAGIHLGIDTHANRPAANSVPDASFYSCSTHGKIYKSNYAGNSWADWATLGAAASGSITASGYTQNTAKLLGRTTASSGAIEEISVGSGLSLSAGSLTATGGFTPVTSSYKRTSGNYTGLNSATFADIDGTNMSFTLTTGAHRVLLGFQSSLVTDAIANVGIDFTIDGTRQGGDGGLWLANLNATSTFFGCTVVYLSAALTAASHTFKVQYKTGAGNLTVSGGSTNYPDSEFWVMEQAA